MKKLIEIIPDLKESKGIFGVEIECEGEGLAVMETKYWKTEADGSLRGHFPDKSAEWVFNSPLSFNEAVKAINQLSSTQKECGAKINFSFRTSTHVHVNMQDLTEDQVLNFIYTYVLIEEVLLNFCGPSRKANRFCLSINDGEGTLDFLNQMFRLGVGSVRRFHENEVRYAALNIAALNKYGSIEIRSMRGTLDIDVLTTWLCALGNLRSFATERTHVHEIHDLFVNNTPENFLRMVLRDVYGDFEYEGMEKDIRKNFSISLELPHAYRVKVVKEEKSIEVPVFDDYLYVPGMKPVAFAEAVQKIRMEANPLWAGIKPAKPVKLNQIRIDQL